jgi:hypothetical protein
MGQKISVKGLNEEIGSGWGKSNFTIIEMI